jgi:hypothetical protein
MRTRTIIIIVVVSLLVFAGAIAGIVLGAGGMGGGSVSTSSTSSTNTVATAPNDAQLTGWQGLRLAACKNAAVRFTVSKVPASVRVSQFGDLNGATTVSLESLTGCNGNAVFSDALARALDYWQACISSALGASVQFDVVDETTPTNNPGFAVTSNVVDWDGQYNIGDIRICAFSFSGANSDEIPDTALAYAYVQASNSYETFNHFTTQDLHGNLYLNSDILWRSETETCDAFSMAFTLGHELGHCLGLYHDCGNNEGEYSCVDNPETSLMAAHASHSDNLPSSCSNFSQTHFAGIYEAGCASAVFSPVSTGTYVPKRFVMRDHGCEQKNDLIM